MPKIFILSLVLLSLVTPIKSFAQEDEVISDSPTIVPSPNTQSTTPISMDESDSGGVSEVDEYDN